MSSSGSGDINSSSSSGTSSGGASASSDSHDGWPWLFWITYHTALAGVAVYVALFCVALVCLVLNWLQNRRARNRALTSLTAPPGDPNHSSTTAPLLVADVSCGVIRAPHGPSSAEAAEDAAEEAPREQEPRARTRSKPKPVVTVAPGDVLRPVAGAMTDETLPLVFAGLVAFLALVRLAYCLLAYNATETNMDNDLQGARCLIGCCTTLYCVVLSLIALKWAEKVHRNYVVSGSFLPRTHTLFVLVCVGAVLGAVVVVVLVLVRCDPKVPDRVTYASEIATQLVFFLFFLVYGVRLGRKERRAHLASTLINDAGAANLDEEDSTRRNAMQVYGFAAVLIVATLTRAVMNVLPLVLKHDQQRLAVYYAALGVFGPEFLVCGLELIWQRHDRKREAEQEDMLEQLFTESETMLMAEQYADSLVYGAPRGFGAGGGGGSSGIGGVGGAACGPDSSAASAQAGVSVSSAALGAAGTAGTSEYCELVGPVGAKARQGSQQQQQATAAETAPAMGGPPLATVSPSGAASTAKTAVALPRKGPRKLKKFGQPGYRSVLFASNDYQDLLHPTTPAPRPPQEGQQTTTTTTTTTTDVTAADTQTVQAQGM